MVLMRIHLIIFFSLFQDVAGAHGVRVKMIMVLGSCPDLFYTWRTDHFSIQTLWFLMSIFWIYSTSLPSGNQIDGLLPASILKIRSKSRL